MAALLDELGYPREVTQEEVISAFLQTIQRSLNCLSAEEQKLRRSAIEKLHVCLLKDDGAGSLPPMDVLQEAWDGVIVDKVLRCVCDPSERCRELAIQLIREVAQSLAEVDCTLKKTVPVMEERMGQIPVLEGSEEIRLQLFSLLIDVLLPESELVTLKDLIDPLHRIVAVTLFDQFHEVQKKSCSVLVTLANRDPEVFGNKTGVFLRGLVPCLNHAHSRVRIAVFQAIDAMMQCGLTKSLVAQQLAPGTKSLAFDHNAAVRELFFSSVGNWLNFKSNTMTDEEIHQCVVAGKIPRFHLPELLPLLLLGVTDDCIDIATLTYERLEGIGEVYKRFMDGLDTRASHGLGGQRFRTPEEDAKLIEKVLEDERKCQEKYERDLKEAEEQRRLQRGSTSEEITTEEEPAQSEPSLYQSLKAQTSAMLKQLNQAELETEKLLGTDMRKSKEPDEEHREFWEDPNAQDTTQLADERSGAGGLHVLTNQADEESTKDTSEITDEGAVKKLETSEDGEETLQLPRPWKGRANAGCRLMVEAFLRPMIEPAVKELKQWRTPTRLCAARFLHTVMVLAEGLAKDHLDILIPAFFRATRDEEVKVVKRVAATIHIIGFHVPPRKWLPLVLKPLDLTKTNPARIAHVLLVTAAFLYGTPHKAMEQRYVAKICDKLYANAVFYSSQLAVLNQLLQVVANLIQVAGGLCKSSSLKIFVLLLRLQSVEGEAELQRRSGQALEELAHALQMESASELYVEHMRSFLDVVSSGCQGWASSLPGKFVFLSFICNAIDMIGPHLVSLMPLFTVCLQSDQDPSLCASFLKLLDKLFEKDELKESWSPLAKDILSKLLVPCAVGRANKAEVAVVRIAVVAIDTFFKQDLCSKELMQELTEMRQGLLFALKTCLDKDFSSEMRRASTSLMHQFLRIAGPILSDLERTNVVEVICKPMDDPTYVVPRAVLPIVEMFYMTMPSNFNEFDAKELLSLLFKCMDDEEHPHLQEAVCQAIQPFVEKKPENVMEVLANVRRSPATFVYIEPILNAAKQRIQKRDILDSPDQTFTIDEVPMSSTKVR